MEDIHMKVVIFTLLLAASASSFANFYSSVPYYCPATATCTGTSPDTCSCGSAIFSLLVSYTHFYLPRKFTLVAAAYEKKLRFRRAGCIYVDFTAPFHSNLIMFGTKDTDKLLLSPDTSAQGQGWKPDPSHTSAMVCGSPNGHWRQIKPLQCPFKSSNSINAG